MFKGQSSERPHHMYILIQSNTNIPTFYKREYPQSSPFSSSMTALCPVNVNVMLVAFFFCCSASIKFGYTALKAALVFYGIYVFSVSTFCPTEWDLQVDPPHQLTFNLLRFTFPFIGFSSDWVNDIFSSQQQVCDDSVPLTCDHSSHFFPFLFCSQSTCSFIYRSVTQACSICAVFAFLYDCNWLEKQTQ